MVAGKDARGRQGLLERGKRLPQGEADHEGEAGDEGADDHGVGGGAGGGVDDAGEDEGGADGEEEGADVVELAEGLLGGEAARVGGWVVVEVEAGKGEDGCDGGAVKEPSPLVGELGMWFMLVGDGVIGGTYGFTVLDGETAGDGADDDGKVNTDI